jgi:rubrerythrin
VLTTSAGFPARRPGPADQAEPRTERARTQLARLLQLAYSGELAAARAYLGHRHSLTDRAERAELWAIICDEVRHRTCVLDMLSELGTVPDPARERKMERVGRAISRFCQVGGWFFPMYGAGRLESQNIREYELAARLAHVAELHRFVAPFLEMAEVEWDHERYFKSKAARHRLWRHIPSWPAPPPREEIRASFRAFETTAAWEVPVVRPPWLVR